MDPITPAQANLVVSKCRIHNDASIDMSADGHLLAALVPDEHGGTNSVTLCVYSLDKGSLGQNLYQWSFGANAISVSLSPMANYIVVGLGTPRAAAVYAYPPINDTATVAQVLRLAGRSDVKACRSFEHVRNIDVARGDDLFSLNSIRWMPGSGEGLIYGTNRGHLVICRPDCSEPKEDKKGRYGECSIIRNQSATTGTQTVGLGLLLPTRENRTLSIGTQTSDSLSTINSVANLTS